MLPIFLNEFALFGAYDYGLCVIVSTEMRNAKVRNSLPEIPRKVKTPAQVQEGLSEQME